MQYQSFDFHEENELPKLLKKLKKIEADGGVRMPSLVHIVLRWYIYSSHAVFLFDM